MRIAVLSPAVLLAACTTSPHPFRDAAAIEAQVAADCRENPDDAEKTVPLSPPKLNREGRTPIVRTGARTRRFADAAYCEGLMPATCDA